MVSSQKVTICLYWIDIDTVCDSVHSYKVYFIDCGL